MLDISGFRPDDLDLFEPQQQHAMEAAAGADWRSMAKLAATHGPAWTGRIQGRVIGCAGFALLWQGRASAWCLLGRDIPKSAWIGIHRAVQARIPQLRELGVRRIEAEAQWGFLAGNRWLRMLGFEHEGLARCYGPGGEDFNRYARVTR